MLDQDTPVPAALPREGDLGILSTVDSATEQLLFETLFDIRSGVAAILQLLGEDEDDEEEET